jgi:hypothetical protein
MARNRSTARRIGLGLAAAGVLAAAALLVRSPEVVELVVDGEVRELRPDAEHAPRPGPGDGTGLLVIAIDGLGRDVLYDALRAGDLPELAALLGGQKGRDLPHALLHPDLLAVLPSSTIPAWASIFSGAPPGEHGVVGNEFFVRESREFAAPAPVSIHDISPALAVYTEAGADQWLHGTTIYERLREREPGIQIWVALSQFYRGADRLLLARRTALANALKAFLAHQTSDDASDRLFATLDEEVVETIADELEACEPPDVLTVYLPGADLHAHRAGEGADTTDEYLREPLDRIIGRLRSALEACGALEDRWVVVVSDHGHTEVLHDARHALGADPEKGPPAVLTSAGYRVRPFEWKVSDDEPFDSVLAYQGAMAYVYLADRSSCDGGPCDWTRPARFEEDVVPVAEAFLAATERGDHVPELRGTIALVLARRPAAPGAQHEPFQVYAGGGRLVPLEEHLARSPEPAYVALAPRLRDLAVGARGERAGDVLLIASGTDRDDIADRYYFSAEYRSWHGSPTRRDSAIPLVVAHPRRTRDEIAAIVDDVLGDHPTQPGVGELIVRLRRDGRELEARSER